MCWRLIHEGDRKLTAFSTYQVGKRMKNKGYLSKWSVIYMDRNFRKNETATAENQMLLYCTFFFFPFWLSFRTLCSFFTRTLPSAWYYVMTAKLFGSNYNARRVGDGSESDFLPLRSEPFSVSPYVHNLRVDVALSRLVSLPSVLHYPFTK